MATGRVGRDHCDDDVSQGDSKIMAVDNIKKPVTYHDDSTDYKMFDVELGF